MVDKIADRVQQGETKPEAQVREPLETIQPSDMGLFNKSNDVLNPSEPAERNFDWKNFERNKEIQGVAGDRAWNPQAQPIPPIEQVLARNLKDDPTAIKAIKDTLQEKSDVPFEKRLEQRLGEALGDPLKAAEAMKAARGDQRNMQFDYASEKIPKMGRPGNDITPGSRLDLSTEDAARLMADKTPDQMRQHLANMDENMGGVEERLWNMLSKKDQGLYDSRENVKATAIDVLSKTMDPVAINKELDQLERETKEFYRFERNHR